MLTTEKNIAPRYPGPVSEKLLEKVQRYVQQRSQASGQNHTMRG